MTRIPVIALALSIALTLAACGQEKSADKAEASAPQVSAEKPVAEPMAAAQTYYDGTNTAPWLALNKACKTEAAANKRGVNCDAYAVASVQANKLIHENPAGFVGVRVKLN
jgi:hypothetical protein